MQHHGRGQCRRRRGYCSGLGGYRGRAALCDRRRGAGKGDPLPVPQKIIERLLRLKWWDLELSQLSGLPFRDIDRCLDMIDAILQGAPVAAQ